MNENEALDIASDFQNYLRRSDKSFIEKYTKAQIKCALSLISHSKSNHQWYKEMENCVKELDEDEKNKQMKTSNGIIKNEKISAFYNKWWFKLLLAPILVGLFLLYLQNNPSREQKSNLSDSSSNDIKKSNISGDVVGRDKIIYQTVSIPIDQKYKVSANLTKGIDAQMSAKMEQPPTIQTQNDVVFFKQIQVSVAHLTSDGTRKLIINAYKNSTRKITISQLSTIVNNMLSDDICRMIKAIAPSILNDNNTETLDTLLSHMCSDDARMASDILLKAKKE